MSNPIGPRKPSKAKPSASELQVPDGQSEPLPEPPPEVPLEAMPETPKASPRPRRNPFAPGSLHNAPTDLFAGGEPGASLRQKIEAPDWGSPAGRRAPRVPGDSPGASGEMESEVEESARAPDSNEGEAVHPTVNPSLSLALPLTDSSGAQRLKSPSTALASFRPFNPAEAGYQEKRPLSGIWVWIIALACLAIGAAAGHFVPKPVDIRSDAPTSAVPRTVPAPITAAAAAPWLTADDQSALDAAYIAWNAGKFVEAEALFTSLYAKHPAWKSLEIEIGRVQLYRHEWSGSHTTLSGAVEKEAVAVDANFSLAILFSVRRQYADAEISFEKAVAVDPTRADIFYFWGESLRNEGKPLEASRKYRAALLRNRYETAESLYRLKLWLSEIESGEAANDGIPAQIEAGLALPRPPMEALFAEAGRDLKAERIKEAADMLNRARQSVERTVFAVVMRDSIFVQEKWRSEIAEFLPSEAPIQGQEKRLNEGALSPVPSPAPTAPEPTAAPPADTTPVLSETP